MLTLIPGTVRHTVLVYAISEPGGWTAESIAQDLPDLDLRELRQAVRLLSDAEWIHVNGFDQRIWPLRAGRDALALAV